MGVVGATTSKQRPRGGRRPFEARIAPLRGGSRRRGYTQLSNPGMSAAPSANDSGERSRTPGNPTSKAAEVARQDPGTFLREWVVSLAELPDDEFDAPQWARYPRVAQVRRSWTQHQTLTGHSGLGDARRSAFIFNVV